MLEGLHWRGPYFSEQLQGGVGILAPHALHIGQQHHAPARMQRKALSHNSVVVKLESQCAKQGRAAHCCSQTRMSAGLVAGASRSRKASLYSST